MALTYTSVLTRKGQATIPAELRVKLGLNEGDRLIWWIEDGQIFMMGAREYAMRMSRIFSARANPARTPLSIEELKEAAAETWTHRHSHAVVEQ